MSVNAALSISKVEAIANASQAIGNFIESRGLAALHPFDPLTHIGIWAPKG